MCEPGIRCFKNSGMIARYASAVRAMAYMARGMRPCKCRKAQIDCPWQNTHNTIWDIEKTMSHVEKIMSDVIKTTSNLFLPISSP